MDKKNYHLDPHRKEILFSTGEHTDLEISVATGMVADFTMIVPHREWLSVLLDLLERPELFRHCEEHVRFLTGVQVVYEPEGPPVIFTPGRASFKGNRVTGHLAFGAFFAGIRNSGAEGLRKIVVSRELAPWGKRIEHWILNARLKENGGKPAVN